MFRFVFINCFIALALACGNVSFAQIQNAAKWKNTLIPAGKYKVGDVIILQMEATIDKGYHVYSAIPPAKDANQPTEFELDKTAKGVKKDGKLKEEGKMEKKYDETFETDLRYYHNKVIFSQKIKITAENALLQGYLHYQVCDTSTCVPADNNFKFNLVAKKNDNNQVDTPLVDTDKADTSSKTITPPPINTNITQNSDQATDAQTIAKKSLWWIFIEAFLWGLLALLTPCVFPMIPMTVSFFTKQSKTRAEGIRNAFSYSFWIVAIYVVLGLLVTVIFGSGALYNLASNPWLNLLFFILLFVFGVSFLGWFEITLPSRWTTAMDAKGNKASFLGIFFMALTLVLVSFSCTGPIVGSLLVLAASGSYLGPTIGMLGFSLAFAIPFGLFALFPSWLQSLPRSGGWLNSVKVFLGFLEIALALKFLSQSDMVWHWEILNREIFLGLWVAIFLLLSLYLLGLIRLPHDSPIEQLSVPRMLLAMITLAFTFYLLPGLWGGKLQMVSGFLPNYSENPTQTVSNPNSNTQNSVCNLPRKYAEKLAKHTPSPFCAFFDLDEAITYAKSINKPVFIDFTGHTCVNCRSMEQNVWTDQAIQQTLHNEYVLVSLYVDDRTELPEVLTSKDGTPLRTVGDKFLDYEKQYYNTNAQPYYVLINPNKTTDNQLTTPRGYNLDRQAFAKFLKDGVENYKK